jgi:serine/threonine protein kinase
MPVFAGDEIGLAKGATIGRYVVLGLLGRGGMGEVYAAYDPELDRKIAVKLLRARGGGESAADGKTRLLREAQAIARLSQVPRRAGTSPPMHKMAASESRPPARAAA